MIILYVFGIPGIVAIHLYRHRETVHTLIELTTDSKHLSENAQHRLRRFHNLSQNADDFKNFHELEKVSRFKEKFSFLFFGYASRAYLWEAVVMVRKAFISLLAVMFAKDIHTQGLFALVLLFICVISQTSMKPFITPRLNHLEFWSLVGTTSIFFAGQFTFAEVPGISQIASYFAIIVNIGYLLFVAYNFYRMYHEMQIQKKENQLTQRTRSKRGDAKTGESNTMQALPDFLQATVKKSTDAPHVEEVELQGISFVPAAAPATAQEGPAEPSPQAKEGPAEPSPQAKLEEHEEHSDSDDEFLTL